MVDDLSRSDLRPRLGRGLAALIGDSKTASGSSDANPATRKAPIEFLYPNPRNSRKTFDEEQLDELAASIRHRGILQPILVRQIPSTSNQFEIVAGERRWRAAQKAGLFEVPIIVLEINEREAVEIGLVENVQRSDLNALEEARGYELLISEHGYTQSDVAQIVGKSRSHVANTMRLLALPERTKSLLLTGALSAGHARALLATKDPDLFVDKIIRDGLTVRDVEKMAQAPSAKVNKPPSVTNDADVESWEHKLALALGSKVQLRYFGGNGEMRIAFRSLDQLEELCLRLIRSRDPQAPE